jgi:hypothetical protein
MMPYWLLKPYDLSEVELFRVNSKYLILNELIVQMGRKTPFHPLFFVKIAKR